MSSTLILRKGDARRSDLIDDVPPVQSYYVDTVNGSDARDGTSWANAFATMAKALNTVATMGTIYFVGDVREEITASNLKFDITIVGCGTPHHADVPAAGYHPGASVWRPPASPTATTPLLKARGRGWRFINILFDAPVDAAAVYLERNALAGTSEFDASHARFIDCRFDSGKVGIENAGGVGFVVVENCGFYRLTESGGAGIKCTSTAVAVPLNWQIKNCHFANNASHILSSMSYARIVGNQFGRFTGTLSVDVQNNAAQGEYNILTQNYLSGAYGVTAYPAGTNNEWAGNVNAGVTGGITDADPA